MGRTQRTANMGGKHPVTTCGKCFKQWKGCDRRTLKKLFEIHMKLEHPNATSEFTPTNIGGRVIFSDQINLIMAEQLLIAKDTSRVKAEAEAEAKAKADMKAKVKA